MFVIEVKACLEEPYAGKRYGVQCGQVVKEVLGVSMRNSSLVAMVQYDVCSLLLHLPTMSSFIHSNSGLFL